MSVKYHQTTFSLLNIPLYLIHYTLVVYLLTYVYGLDIILLLLFPLLFVHIIALILLLYLFLISPYICILLYFGANTRWYLQFHLLCAKLLLSFMTKSSFCFYLRLATTFIIYQKEDFFYS